MIGFAAGILLRVPVERLIGGAGGSLLVSASGAPPRVVARGGGGWPRPRPALALGLVTGAVFAALAWRLGPGLDLLAFLVLAAAGVVLAVVDLRTFRLPDAVVASLFLAGLTLLGIEALALDEFRAYVRALLGALALSAFHLVLAVARAGALGWGDVKLAAVLGFHLGWLGWDVLAAGAFLSFTGAGVTAVVMLATHRARPETVLAFGPWMLVGALGGVLCGEELVTAYLGW